MARLEVDRVYVIHVSTGAEDRAASIERQLARLGIDFEYVLEGDMKDLTPEWLDRWFDGPMKCVQPRTSCCSKHLIAYQRMLRDGWNDALVLEDDIFLSDDFVEAAERRACGNCGAAPVPVGCGVHLAGELRAGPIEQVAARSSPGVTLYRAPKGRDTGAYWLIARERRAVPPTGGDRRRSASPRRSSRTSLFESGAVELCWRHPAIAEQGSHQRQVRFAGHEHRTGRMRRPRWLARKAFQLYLRPIIDRPSIREVTLPHTSRR